MQRGLRASLVVGLSLFVVALMTASPHSVSAHAMLLSTEPAEGTILDTAPEQVTLTFSEPVSVVDGGTVLYVRGYDPRPLTPAVQDETVTVSLPIDLADGTYALQWRVISADGHPMAGTLMFSIGQPSLAVDVPILTTSSAMEWGMNVSVWAKYLGLLATTGLLIGGWSYTRPDWRALIRIVRWTAMLAILGAVLELPFAAAVQTGHDRWQWASMRQLDSSSLIAAVLVVAGMAVVLMLSVRDRFWSRVVATVMAVIACLAPLLTGHTRTQSPESVMMLADTVHLLAASFWLGGLIILTLGLRRSGHLVSFATPAGAIATVSRFSTLAAWSVLLLAGSGTAMTWVILEAPRDLIDTDYGRDLLLKVALVLVIVVLAALNRFRILPRLERDYDVLLPRLRRLVVGELMLLIVVVGVTSVLVQQNPNTVAEAVQPTVLFDGSIPLDKDHTATVIVRDTGDERVTVVVAISSSTGPLDEPLDSVNAEWTLPDEGLGPITVRLFPDELSTSYGGTTALPSSGDWTLTIRARIDRFTDSRGSVTVSVP
ncbi:MAG: copper resistance protein CopC [Thermomicrobiales bacterium]|nr:copper resistance protein CopC [Thermomicrobiales bacterium]MCO5229015.1 copper resistance protein CopC [Thermomicrobiales bacterium]